MSYSLPVNVTILLAFVISVLYLAGFHNVFTSYQENECEMTYMFQYPQFVEISLSPEVHKAYPKYALYGYGEGGITEQVRKKKFKGIPVLFLPGSSGSHKQGRSLASVSLRKSLNSRTPFHFNYFMIDFNEEKAAFFGGVLEDQEKFAVHCIQKILTLYKNNTDSSKPESVILIGHSVGGLIAKGIFTDPEFDSNLVSLIITMATPHKYPLIQPDKYIPSYYKKVNNFWKNNSDLEHISVISIGGGLKDFIVNSGVTYDSDSEINVLSTAVPGVWIPNDHLSIMWCKQLVLTVVRALFDSVDLSTKQLSTDKDYRNNVFQYHFLKRSAGKRYSVSITSRFSSFERSNNWFENLQRQFTVVEANGIKSNHYIMIRLFFDPKSEAAFIEAYNVNVKDWLFVCSADLVHNSIRMCETGENISNMTEIAPVNMNLNLKRKFVYLNLLELKMKSFTHVLVRLPPLSYFMQVNVDVHQPSERNIKYQVPKFYSLSSETVVEKTQDNSAYYSIHLVGFEYIWQSYTLKLKVLSCKTAKNQAVASLITPWSNEDQHFIFKESDLLTIPLNLISPKPKNFSSTSHPFVRFHLDPTCKYQMTIQPSIIGMFAQGARYYTPMLPGFITTVIILTLRQQIKNLDEGKCGIFHSALSTAVRRYYIVLQVTVLGSKLLGLSVCLLFLPEPDFLSLQDLNLDSFFMTILLYAVAIIVAYISGAAAYFTIITSGQTVHKWAIRIVADGISGLFNWSEWVISVFQQVPIIVTVILVSLSISTCGALGLFLGAFFYFLKLCKMYEEYLEDWFYFSIKLIARKVKDVITKKMNPRGKKKEDEPKEENKEKEGKELTELPKSEPDSGPVESVPQEEDDESEVDLLSAINFHISTFLVWFLTAVLYTPSLLTWAKNYHYSISLEKDPALIPSILISACGAILWQSGVPKPCRKLSQITSSILFVLAVVSIIYASLSLYRLGYILSASLLVVSLNQIKVFLY